MRIKIVTNFSKARMESFYRFHFLKRSTYRVIEFIAVIISMILSLLGLVLNNTYLFAIFLVMCLVIILTRKYRINRIAKNIIKKNPPLVSPYTILIQDETISYTKDDTYKQYNIDKTISVCEIDECFYVYVEQEIALIIPKYLLKLDDKDKLRKMFTEKCQFKQYKFVSTSEADGDLKI